MWRLNLSGVRNHNHHLHRIFWSGTRLLAKAWVYVKWRVPIIFKDWLTLTAFHGLGAVNWILGICQSDWGMDFLLIEAVEPFEFGFALTSPYYWLGVNWLPFWNQVAIQSGCGLGLLQGWPKEETFHAPDDRLFRVLTPLMIDSMISWDYSMYLHNVLHTWYQEQRVTGYEPERAYTSVL